MKTFLAVGALLASSASFVSVRSFMSCPGSSCDAPPAVSVASAGCPVMAGSDCCQMPSVATLAAVSGTESAEACPSEDCPPCEFCP